MPFKTPKVKVTTFFNPNVKSKKRLLGGYKSTASQESNTTDGPMSTFKKTTATVKNNPLTGRNVVKVKRVTQDYKDIEGFGGRKPTGAEKTSMTKKIYKKGKLVRTVNR